MWRVNHSALSVACSAVTLTYYLGGWWPTPRYQRCWPRWKTMCDVMAYRRAHVTLAWEYTASILVMDKMIARLNSMPMGRPPVQSRTP